VKAGEACKLEGDTPNVQAIQELVTAFKLLRKRRLVGRSLFVRLPRLACVASGTVQRDAGYQMPSWLTKPETVYATILFFLSAVVSLFAGEIKQYFKTFPLKLNEKVIALNRTELRTLERLHNNAYTLLLWALWNFVGPLRYALFFALAFGAFSLGDYFIFHKPVSLVGMSWTPIITGGFVGPAFVMYSTLKSFTTMTIIRPA
jgi:hypothetical protein